MLNPTLRNINRFLVRWARRKYKRLEIHYRQACWFLASVARREPNLFAHWRFGMRPDGWATGAG
jgi:RNA-directed DNA polymerase